MISPIKHVIRIIIPNINRHLETKLCESQNKDLLSFIKNKFGIINEIAFAAVDPTILNIYIIQLDTISKSGITIVTKQIEKYNKVIIISLVDSVNELMD
jgi:hypothetical protein